MASAGKNTKVNETKPDESADIIDADVVEQPDEEAVQAPQPAAPKKPSAVPLVLGGIVAGAIGFGAALFITGNTGLFSPDTSAMDQLAADNVALGGDLAALQSELAALQGAVAGAATQSDIDGLAARDDRAASQAEEQAQALANLGGRLTDLENRPIPDVGATAQAVATYERELAAMRQMFADELSKVEAKQAASAAALTHAASQSVSTAKQLALAAVQKAVELGDGFSEPLNTLSAASISVPEGLKRAAVEGVPTMGAVQDRFPAAARAALDAAIRADVAEGTGNKLTAFLRTQLGARSLAPKDGDDPDAILSRAEDALRQGDIAGALAEVATLPVAGVDNMTDWVNFAQKRLTVVEALNELSATMGY
ncbi:MAG: hypothetical protein V3U96_06050 [Paracoccaceae bacterium]